MQHQPPQCGQCALAACPQNMHGATSGGSSARQWVPGPITSCNSCSSRVVSDGFFGVTGGFTGVSGMGDANGIGESALSFDSFDRNCSVGDPGVFGTGTGCCPGGGDGVRAGLNVSGAKDESAESGWVEDIGGSPSIIVWRFFSAWDMWTKS